MRNSQTLLGVLDVVEYEERTNAPRTPTAVFVAVSHPSENTGTEMVRKNGGLGIAVPSRR